MPISRTLRLATLPMAFGLAACADSSFQYTPQAIPIASLMPGISSTDWNVTDVIVKVPEDLTVSMDPNARIPATAIVWWGEPGNTAEQRRCQVGRIIHEGVAGGAAAFSSGAPVVAEVVLRRFHAITPRARSSCPLGFCFGNTNIDMVINIKDRATGDKLATSGLIEADPETLQLDDYVAAEQAGNTERKRIVDHVNAVTRAWLASVVAPSETAAVAGPVAARTTTDLYGSCN